MRSQTFIQKVNRSPFNLTSEAVLQILKSQSHKLPSFKKICPMVKYEMEGIKLSTQLIFKKKIRQLERIDSPPKNSGNKTRYHCCQSEFKKYQQTDGTREKHIDSNSDGKTNHLISLPNEKQITVIDISMGHEEISSEKDLEKVQKIKLVKLRHGKKNKFSINTKAFQTKQGYTIVHQMSKKEIVQQNNINDNQDDTQNIFNNKQESVEEKENNIKQDKQEDVVRNSEKIFKNKKIFVACKRDSEQNPADIRFEKMRNHLSKILLSFGCRNIFLEGELVSYSRYCRKYKYYVGAGNNKNLIISLMKKRWWWTEVNSMNDANFIWTQLKQAKILQEVQKSKVQSPPIFCRVVTEKSLQNSMLTRGKKTQGREQQISPLFHPESKIKISENKIQNEVKCQTRSIIVPQKIHNHYEGNGSIGNKKALFLNFSLYCQYKNINKYEYIPLTFYISSKKCSQIKKFQQNFKSKPQSYWLIKPGENSNRGNGITITNELKQIKLRINSLTSGKTLIIQQYIKNLFLFNYRKFDIRTYMCAITIGGSTKYYWHEEGYLRTSSFTFNLSNCDDVFIHLTNDAVQCQSDQYSKFEDGNKISYKQFQRYLDDHFSKKKYSIKKAHEKMKYIAEMAVKATYPLINYSYLQFGFQVFGLDFILDSDFNPWLIEINTNPCLELSSTCLKRLIPQMIQNVLRIGLDPIYPPCTDFPRTMSCFVPDNIILTNKFSLIFDDFFDRDLIWQDKFSCLPTHMEDGEEQQFKGDGEILTL